MELALRDSGQTERTEGRRQLAGLDKAGHVEQAEERLVRNSGVMELERIRSIDDALHGCHDGREHGPESNYSGRGQRVQLQAEI